MNALFIKPSSLGDIVHGLQLAESLKREIDDLKISWVSREMFAPLVESCRTVEEVFIFNRYGGLWDFIRLLGDVRKREFEWVIDLQGLFRSGLICFFSRGENKAGRADAREGAKFFYPQMPPLPETGKGSHALEILLQFRKLFDLPPELSGAIQFNSDLPEAVKDKLLSNNSAAKLLFFPESRRAEKEWPYFEKLSSRLLKTRKDIQIIWVASKPIEVDLPFPREHFVNLSGETSIESLPALIETADIVLSNDSGPMHLAAALNKPTLGLFGPTSPTRFGPWGQLDRVLTAPEGDLRNLDISKVQEQTEFEIDKNI